MSQDQDWLMDFLYSLQDLIATICLMKYLEGIKKLGLKSKSVELMNAISNPEMLLSERESVAEKYVTSINSTRSIFQQVFKSNGLVNFLLTVGSVFTYVIECITLLTTQKKMTEDKERSISIVQQFFIIDCISVAEVLQIYPLGVVASPKPKGTAQDQNCKCIPFYYLYTNSSSICHIYITSLIHTSKFNMHVHGAKEI